MAVACAFSAPKPSIQASIGANATCAPSPVNALTMAVTTPTPNTMADLMRVRLSVLRGREPARVGSDGSLGGGFMVGYLKWSRHANRYFLLERSIANFGCGG